MGAQWSKQAENATTAPSSIACMENFWPARPAAISSKLKRRFALPSKLPANKERSLCSARQQRVCGNGVDRRVGKTRLERYPLWREGIEPCPCRKSDPDVLVVETTENWPRKNPTDGMNYTSGVNVAPMNVARPP